MQVLEFKKPHLVSSFYKDIENVIEGLKNVNAYEIDEIINEENSNKPLNDQAISDTKEV